MFLDLNYILEYYLSHQEDDIYDNHICGSICKFQNH